MTENPFSPPATTEQTQPAALIQVEQERAVAEIQSAMTIAKRFPRSQPEAMDRILTACARPSLARSALYSYARGGTSITGPTIRLAEAIAQQWGNLHFGIRELDQRNGNSTVESFAWDIETNIKETKEFQVKHFRHTKRGGYDLKDPRDIYEAVANQGARRLRSCILGIIPGDVVDAAVEQCHATLKADVDITPELLKSLVEKFAKYDVTKKMIEERIQRKLDAITPALVIQLGNIHNSLKDGMSGPADWFNVETTVSKGMKTVVPQGDEPETAFEKLTQYPLANFQKLRTPGIKSFVTTNKGLFHDWPDHIRQLVITKFRKEAKWEVELVKLTTPEVPEPDVAEDGDEVETTGSGKAGPGYIDCPEDERRIAFFQCETRNDGKPCESIDTCKERKLKMGAQSQQGQF